MSETVKCATHGESAATIVCTHILSTLSDEPPRGFLWMVDEDGEYQAVCAACDDLSDADWEDKQGDLGAVICLECFRLAAAYNGVQLDGVSLQ